MRRAIFLFLLFGIGAKAQDDNQVSITLPTASGTITAKADRVSGDFKTKGAILEGHVVVRDGANTLGAPLIRLHFANDKVDRAIAERHMTIATPNGVAIADNGTYEVAPQIVILSGHVVLTKDGNVLRGEKLRYDIPEGLATMEAGPGSRVKALFATKQKD